MKFMDHRTQRIDKAHCILFVDDQTRARDFYRALLERQERLDVPGMTEFELRPGLILGLMPRSSMRSLLGLAAGNHSSELYLVVPEPEPLIQRAQIHGATLLSPLTERDWGARVAYLLDPDGHILALADREV